MDALEIYSTALAQLRTDRSRSRWPAQTTHRAPHKPLLLLAVMDAMADGTITANLIELTPELGELFTLYWAQVMPPDRRGEIALPFFHLQGDGFWHLLPRPGKEQVIAGGGRLRSVAQIRENALGARLDDDLYQLLTAPAGREHLRLVLIQGYFASSLHANLLGQSVVNERASLYSRYLLEQADAEQLRAVQEESDQPEKVRDQGFRRAIVKAYTHQCGFCGIRMLTADGHTAVDAAHIVPWSESRDDRPQNGVALCKLCHWAFDEGLMGLSERYRIAVSRQMQQGDNRAGHLMTLDGRELIGPQRQEHWPDPQSLRWHAKHVFRRR